MIRSIILCAGQGTRLRPLTDDKPKCMVELCGIPLLERQIGVIRHCGIEDVTLIGGYGAEHLAISGVRLILNEQYAFTNMVYSLFTASDMFDGSSDLFISYGDLVYEPRVLRKLLEAPFDLSLTADMNWEDLWSARMENYLDDVESFRFKPDGGLLELGRKVHSRDDIEAQYMGLIKVSANAAPLLRDVFQELMQSEKIETAAVRNMYMTRFIQYLLDAGTEFHVVKVFGGWLEVDSVADLAKYEEMEAEGTLRHLCDLSCGK